MRRLITCVLAVGCIVSLGCDRSDARLEAAYTADVTALMDEYQSSVDALTADVSTAIADAKREGRNVRLEQILAINQRSNERVKVVYSKALRLDPPGSHKRFHEAMLKLFNEMVAGDDEYLRAERSGRSKEADEILDRNQRTLKGNHAELQARAAVVGMSIPPLEQF